MYGIMSSAYNDSFTSSLAFISSCLGHISLSYFFVSPFCLCVLDRSFVTPNLLWFYDEGVFLGSVLQSSRSLELHALGMCLVGYVHLPVVVES